MKRVITFWTLALLMTAMILNIYCKQEKPKAEKVKAERVLAVFLNRDSTDANYDMLWRVIKDSIRIDTNNIKRNDVYRDTSYYLERADTVRVNGIPQFDSLGKVRLQPIYLYLAKSSVWDSNISVDSARKRFDPHIKKGDSTKVAVPPK